MAKTLKRIMRWVFNGLSIIIVVVSVLLMVSVVFTAKGQIPQVMGYSMLRVLTGSMEPAVPENSLILVSRQKSDTLQVGDVISFYSMDPSLDGMVNTHRISRIEEENGTLTIYTQGDANAMEDTYATDDAHLIGKVIWVSHPLGVLVRLVSNPLIFVPIIIAPLVMILVYHLIQVIHTTKVISDEQEEAYQEALEKIKRKKEQDKQEKQEKQEKK